MTARSFSPSPGWGCGSSRRTSRRIPPTPSSPFFKAPRERGRARTRADRDRDPQPPAGRELRLGLCRCRPAGLPSLLLSGAFYEPILAVIPPWDQQGQLERMAAYLRSRFGVTPRGAWIAERVWEPELPDALFRAGIEYTLVDDHHFLLAGAEPGGLGEPYRVESTMGHVGVFPIERELRYRIPFQPVPELLEFFASSPGPPGVRVFGDDGEKFGVWPHTYEWVYGTRWLTTWLTALEERRGIEAVPMGEAWDQRRPTRTIALPAASYPEMMLWALPPETHARIEEEQRWLETQGKQDLARRIATGTWREFLARYPESRRLHRRVSELSARIEHARHSCLAQDPYEDARKEVHRAQCNCSYWHGVFGGFYLPHLREAVRAHMLRADALADGLLGGTAGWTVEQDEEEVRLKSSRVSIGVSRRSGAIVEMADRRRPFDFAGVIARRREAYHVRVEEASRRAALSKGGQHAGDRSAEHGEGGKPETIHGAISVKEPGLERLLEYDERPRHASQEWLRSAAEISSGGLRASIGLGPVGLRFAHAGTRTATAGASAEPPVITLESERGARAAVPPHSGRAREAPCDRGRAPRRVRPGLLGGGGFGPLAPPRGFGVSPSVPDAPLRARGPGGMVPGGDGLPFRRGRGARVPGNGARVRLSGRRAHGTDPDPREDRGGRRCSLSSGGSPFSAACSRWTARPAGTSCSGSRSSAPASRARS
ncbi:MAG: DUF1925 domain-containing protein [Candidatus Eisenbacteria bacterium]|uniref:DUF1925 domain-containing protein n=1 Tax=Eiseniibacteriota bacterium TaxID=2212470 RepID=A0A538SAN5_UNCEI|nr:MAG: DUF1925 domain-containing protein [Candidatus Eisenbacteria bacterium]